MMPLFSDFNDIPSSIFNIIFVFIIAIQLFWLLFFYSRIAFHKEKMLKNIILPPVSIIIIARNEEDNLTQFLPQILNQKYPEFEVIVVNHQSTDETKNILNAFKVSYPHLRTIELYQDNFFTPGKKLPLTIGIKGAKFEHLLLTDADCEPNSNLWLKTMASQFSEKKKIVFGYAPYRTTNGFLNKLIRLDTTFIALHYLSYAKAGFPYMGVGRNLAYTQQLFFDNKGFKSHYSYLSGDDDLFIQEVAKNNNYTISLSPDSFCYSDGKETWKDWKFQKTRHYSTSSKYSLIKKLLLGIYPFTLILIWISFLLLLINGWMTWASIILMLILIGLKWFILGKIFIKLEQKTFIGGIIFWDLFYAILLPFIYFSPRKSVQKKWK